MSPDAARAVESEELGPVLREYLEVAHRLQRTHDALRSEVLRLRQELASKDQELERRRRLAALGELAAGVAHEVRNPLGAIQLYSELLRKECGRLGPALELIEKIEAGIRAIDCVVQDTLALVPRECRFQSLPLLSIIQRAESLAASVLHETHVRLEVQCPHPRLEVTADAEALARVLVNLISNAAEVSRPGDAVQVQVAESGDGWVSVAVRDRGPGVPEELLERVFDPFFTTKPRGNGLGLTIAHRLVEWHGGSLRARNRPEGGAEFIMTLPLGAPGQASQTRPARRPHAA